jgi:hypothetical protein
MQKFVKGRRLFRRVARISEIVSAPQDLPKIVDVFVWDDASGRLVPAIKMIG